MRQRTAYTYYMHVWCAHQSELKKEHRVPTDVKNQGDPGIYFCFLQYF